MNSGLSFRPFLLTLAGISVFPLSFSQGNYKAGYRVTLKGDTIRGFVDYHPASNEKNPVALATGLPATYHKTKSYNPLGCLYDFVDLSIFLETKAPFLVIAPLLRGCL